MDNNAYLARVRYQCRRGMLELDALLQEFFEQQFVELTQKEQQIFVNLLENSDQDLYNWLIKKQPINDTNVQMLIDKIITTPIVAD